MDAGTLFKKLRKVKGSEYFEQSNYSTHHKKYCILFSQVLLNR
jgi:hypothetical protein